ACVELPALAFTALLFATLFLRAPLRTLLYFLPPALVLGWAFFYTNYLAIGQWMPAYGEFGGPWYEYEGSIWKLFPGEARLGIEWASQKESRLGYAVHFLLGHHGVFSLTPIWLLALLGAVAGVRAAGPGAPDNRNRALGLIAALTLILTVVVTAFFLTWQQRWNYGGWTSGPRWLIWLTPFWLLSMVPAADWLARRRS